MLQSTLRRRTQLPRYTYWQPRFTYRFHTPQIKNCLLAFNGSARNTNVITNQILIAKYARITNHSIDKLQQAGISEDINTKKRIELAARRIKTACLTTHASKTSTRWLLWSTETCKNAKLWSSKTLSNLSHFWILLHRNRHNFSHFLWLPTSNLHDPNIWTLLHNYLRP